MSKNINLDLCKNILSFSEHKVGVSKKTDTLSKAQLKELDSWFRRIGVAYTISQLHISQHIPLYNLFLTRINDYPNPSAIDEAIEKGLADYIFYAKLYECNPTELQLKQKGYSIDFIDRYLDQKCTIEELDKLRIDFIDNTYIKYGDIVRFYGEGYRENGKYIYDGYILEELGDDINGYGNIPTHYSITEFPTVLFFKNVMDYNTNVWIEPTGIPLQFIGKSKDDKYYRYRTSDDYIIYYNGTEDLNELYLNDEISNLFAYSDPSFGFGVAEEVLLRKNPLVLVVMS
jgi:hypothetical protein